MVNAISVPIGLIKLLLENMYTPHAWLVKVDFEMSRVGATFREEAYSKMLM